MPLTITDNRADFDALDARLAEADELAGIAGIFTDEELAERGARHEFGLGVPKRPWLSASTDDITPRLATMATAEFTAVVDGRQDADGAMLELAEAVAEAAVDYVEAGRAVGEEPLSDAAKRNDPRPLIDTGDMIGAVEAEVMPEREAPT